MPRRAGRVAEIAFAEFSAPASRVVLDTHAWVGYLAPDAYPLNEDASRAVAAAQQAGGMLVPDVAVWEIALKAGRGSMRLQMPVRDWIDRARSAPGTRMVPFTVELMMRTAELPPGAPADPFDRAIIVTAMAAGAPLVTADRGITAFAKEGGVVRVIPAR
jgi:PIN domain nuclease of toxin-antitoxin system